MKEFMVTFRIPAGYVGVDIDEDMYYSFEDDATEDEINAEIAKDFSSWVDDIIEDLSSWVDDIIEDLRMSAEYEIEEGAEV